MSGQDGSRGYLVQSIIALLKSLDTNDWSEVTIEADSISGKVDIAWRSNDGLEVHQVKSSINQISKSLAKKWAYELESQTDADRYYLTLIGPCSGSVLKMGSHGKVTIPRPKNLDLSGLISETSYLLGRFLENRGYDRYPFNHLEAICNALITKISLLGSEGKTLTKLEFIQQLENWIVSNRPVSNTCWERVCFSNQRGIENAIAGSRLGPKDVDSCPELSMCDDIEQQVEKLNHYFITGDDGCGKSITAWHVAKRFYNKGYIVLRPDYSAKPERLLTDLIFDYPTFLVIDDAQQFTTDFLNRLIEQSSGALKVLFISTSIGGSVHMPAIISPIKAIDEIKKFLLTHRDKTLKVVQQFDSDVSDRYMGESLERRIDLSGREKTPWNFFWVLRGGWKYASRELENLSAYPEAKFLLLEIAVQQVISCDTGVNRDKLIELSKKYLSSEADFDDSLEKLLSFGLVAISDDFFRTKHISYARHILTLCFSYRNQDLWDDLIPVTVESITNPNVSLKGVYWLLITIDLTDATRFGNVKRWQEIYSLIDSRCKTEWAECEWAAGCYYYLLRMFGLSEKKFQSDKHYLQSLMSVECSTSALLCARIANEIINISRNKDERISERQANKFFEQLDYEKLIKFANTMSVNDMYGLSEFLDRVTFYSPHWMKDFILRLDWDRTLSLIEDADPTEYHAVDQLVSIFFLMDYRQGNKANYKYIVDIIPYISKAFEKVPLTTLSDTSDIFMKCLGLGPHFLRGGVAPDDEQLRVAREITSNLSPSCITNSMGNFVSRDLENLARTLSVLSEIDEGFIDEILLSIPHDEFNKSIRRDWVEQSDELQRFLTQFHTGKPRKVAQQWLSQNQKFIEGPLCSILVSISPSTAIEFYEKKRGINLFGKDMRWALTVFATYNLADYDEEKCINILRSEIDKIHDALYRLSLESPGNIVAFFRLLYDLSIELYTQVVNGIKLDDSRALATIERLRKNQPKERENYIRLAKVAIRSGGEIEDVGSGILKALN